MHRLYLGRSPIRTLLAAAILLILCAAAIIKILYPIPLLKDFYFTIAVFEIVLAIGLLFFSNRGEIWIILALVFTAWGGYSLYTTVFGLPCPCLGAALTLPRGSSFIVNSLVVGASWWILRKTPLSLQSMRYIAGFSLVLLVIGFVCAYFMYQFNLQFSVEN